MLVLRNKDLSSDWGDYSRTSPQVAKCYRVDDCDINQHCPFNSDQPLRRPEAGKRLAKNSCGSYYRVGKCPWFDPPLGKKGFGKGYLISESSSEVSDPDDPHLSYPSGQTYQRRIYEKDPLFSNRIWSHHLYHPTGIG